jgi:NADH:ubiquinone oxidoreductase subunit 5 (subunit L)/multisubunit Na+/H+ antiporter MnhA subunit
MASLNYPKSVAAALKSAETVLLLAPKAMWQTDWSQKALPKSLSELTTRMLKGVDAGDMGSVVSSVGGEIHRVYAAVLPSGVSRHNSASRSESISRAAKGKLKKGTCAVILGLDSQDHAEAAVAAIARTLHLYCKYGFDELNAWLFGAGARVLGTGLWKAGDQTVIDGIVVNGSARLVGWFSGVVRLMQTGILNTYAFLMLFGILAGVSWVMWRFWH